MDKSRLVPTCKRIIFVFLRLTSTPLSTSDLRNHIEEIQNYKWTVQCTVPTIKTQQILLSVLNSIYNKTSFTHSNICSLASFFNAFFALYDNCFSLAVSVARGSIIAIKLSKVISSCFRQNPASFLTMV